MDVYPQRLDERDPLRALGSLTDLMSRLRVTDTAGVVAVCRAGLEAGAEAGGAMEAAVASVSVVLLLVILGSLATLILVRRRRRAQLENMRQLPS